FDGGTEPVWSVASDRHHLAAFYRNGALHHFVNRAIVELVLVQLGKASSVDTAIDAAWAEALRLRDLLKFEFFFADKPGFRRELAAELELLDPAWRGHVGSPERATALLRRSGALVARRALLSFVEAQL